MSVSAALCSVKLRDGNPCRWVATHDGFCAYNAALADELGQDVVVNGDPTDEELHLVFALSYATEIRAVVDSGREARLLGRRDPRHPSVASSNAVDVTSVLLPRCHT